MEEMLKVEDLTVSIQGKVVLKDVLFSLNYGEVCALFGPNGAGKTTFIMTLMGFPRYKIEKGRIFFKGIDVTEKDLHERARLGMGIAFQKPTTVKGVKLKRLLEIISGGADEKEIIEHATKLNLAEHLERDVNDGFSGGEIKRSELLQLLIQEPELVFIDEPESGVDIENMALIGEMLNHLLLRDQKVRDPKKSAIIITHTGHILDYVNADRGCLLYDGRFLCGGNPRDILTEIKRSGYKRCVSCL
jgi:Fe-S cluster assembly ATP-binding protein